MIGRLYAPKDRYVLVPSPLGRDSTLLVIERLNESSDPPALRCAPVGELDRLIGPAGKRAQSCAVSAVVGLLAYPDDHSFVIVTECRHAPL